MMETAMGPGLKRALASSRPRPADFHRTRRTTHRNLHRQTWSHWPSRPFGTRPLTPPPKGVQRMRSFAENEKPAEASRAAGVGGTRRADQAAETHAQRLSPGVPLDPTARSLFEPVYGHDFSTVRVHADASAEQAAGPAECARMWYDWGRREGLSRA
jgi:hypothetical protein